MLQLGAFDSLVTSCGHGGWNVLVSGQVRNRCKRAWVALLRCWCCHGCISGGSEKAQSRSRKLPAHAARASWWASLSRWWAGTAFGDKCFQVVQKIWAARGLRGFCNWNLLARLLALNGGQQAYSLAGCYAFRLIRWHFFNQICFPSEVIFQGLAIFLSLAYLHFSLLPWLAAVACLKAFSKQNTGNGLEMAPWSMVKQRQTETCLTRHANLSIFTMSSGLRCCWGCLDWSMCCQPDQRQSTRGTLGSMSWKSLNVGCMSVLLY